MPGTSLQARKHGLKKGRPGFAEASLWAALSHFNEGVPMKINRLYRTAALAILTTAAAYCQATAQFPSALVGWVNTGAIKNASQSTLSTAVTDTTGLSWAVADGTKFLAIEYIVTDTEISQICSISTNTLTLCTGSRGALTTTAATHVSGSSVRGNIMDRNLNQLSAEVIAIETQLGISLANVLLPGQWGATMINTGAAGLGTGETIVSLFANRMNRSVTIQEIWCQVDSGTLSVQLQRNNGSTSNILTGALACSTTGAASTTFNSGVNVIASTNTVTYVNTTNTGTPTRVTLVARYQ